MDDDGAEPQEATEELTAGVKRSERLIRLFLDLVPGQLDALAEALDQENAEAVRAHAHKLKGSCLAIMAEPMARAAERLQHDAAEGDLSHGAALVEELAERFMSVSALLQQELAG